MNNNLQWGSWFKQITGVEEEEWLTQRAKSVLQSLTRPGYLSVRNIATGKVWNAGAFTVHSLSALERRVGAAASKCKPPVFEIHTRASAAGLNRVEVSSLQAALPADGDSYMFQVASNFNCL